MTSAKKSYPVPRCDAAHADDCGGGAQPALLSSWDLGRTLNSACVRDIYDYRVIACVAGPRPKEHLKRGPGRDYRVSKIIMLRRLACITGIKWREV